MSLPVSADRPPSPRDNPRHAVWIEDEDGLRQITAANPGDVQISVEGVTYTHTKERNGQWVYTKEQ